MPPCITGGPGSQSLEIQSTGQNAAETLMRLISMHGVRGARRNLVVQNARPSGSERAAKEVVVVLTDKRRALSTD